MMHPAMAIVATIVNEKTAQRSVSNMAMTPSTGNVARSDDGQMTLRHDGSRGRARAPLIRSRRLQHDRERHVMPKIKQAKILIVATDGFEQSELLVPQEKLSDAGATVEVAAPKSRQKSRKIYGRNKDDWGKSVSVDKDLDEVNVADYDARVLPGGQIDPDKLRLDPKAIEIIRAFLDAGKVVAAICHAPWLLIEAGAVKGRR